MVFMAAYRAWAYEQELDSLLWRVDFKDLIVRETHTTGRYSKVS